MCVRLVSQSLPSYWPLCICPIVHTAPTPPRNRLFIMALFARSSCLLATGGVGGDKHLGKLSRCSWNKMGRAWYDCEGLTDAYSNVSNRKDTEHTGNAVLSVCLTGWLVVWPVVFPEFSEHTHRHTHTPVRSVERAVP